jgi:hypothetical protein
VRRAGFRPHHHREVADRLVVLAERPRVANPDRVPLAALDGGRRHPAADGDLDQLGDRARVGPMPGRALPVGDYLQVALAADRVGDHVRRAGDRLQYRCDFLGGPDHVLQPPAQDADPDGGIHAGGEHVHPVLDRHRPDVRPPGHLHHPVQLAAEPGQLDPVPRPEQQPPGEPPRQLRLKGVQCRHRLQERQRAAAAVVGVAPRGLLGLGVPEAVPLLHRRADGGVCHLGLAEQCLQDQPGVQPRPAVEQFRVEARRVFPPPLPVVLPDRLDQRPDQGRLLAAE